MEPPDSPDRSEDEQPEEADQHRQARQPASFLGQIRPDDRECNRDPGRAAPPGKHNQHVTEDGAQLRRGLLAPGRERLVHVPGQACFGPARSPCAAAQTTRRRPAPAMRSPLGAQADEPSEDDEAPEAARAARPSSPRPGVGRRARVSGARVTRKTSGIRGWSVPHDVGVRLTLETVRLPHLAQPPGRTIGYVMACRREPFVRNNAPVAWPVDWSPRRRDRRHRRGAGRIVSRQLRRSLSTTPVRVDAPAGAGVAFPTEKVGIEPVPRRHPRPGRAQARPAPDRPGRRPSTARNRP